MLYKCQREDTLKSIFLIGKEMSGKFPKKTKKSVEEDSTTSPLQKIVAPVPFVAPKGIKSKIKREPEQVKPNEEPQKDDSPKREDTLKKEERSATPKREEREKRPSSPRREEPRPSSPKREELRPASPRREEPRPTSPRRDESRPSSPKREEEPLKTRKEEKEEISRSKREEREDSSRTRKEEDSSRKEERDEIRASSPKREEREEKTEASVPKRGTPKRREIAKPSSILQELVMASNTPKPAVLPKRTVLMPTLVVRAPAQTTLPPVELPSTPKSPPILRQARSPLRSPSRVSFGKSESHSIAHRTSTDYLPEVGVSLTVKTLCIGDLKSLYNKLSQYDTWEQCEKALESQSRGTDYCIVFGMSQPKYTLKASGSGWELK